MGRRPSSFSRSTDDPKEQHISETRINDRIRVAEVRLVGPAGEQVGIVRLEDALRLAQDADLDLVEVAPDARPPVVKIMDYGKFKYEADMKAREARRNQANTVLKEIRFRLKIDPHDYGTKKGHVERFLRAGDKVKVMIQFRGREQSRPEAGIRLLSKLAEDVTEFGFVESQPKQDGRNMVMVIAPVKKKAEQRNEARRAAQAKARAQTPESGATEPATPEPASPEPPLVTQPAVAASAPPTSAPLAPEPPARASKPPAASLRAAATKTDAPVPHPPEAGPSTAKASPRPRPRPRPPAAKG
ncbi:MAG: translation initiation factor IF-3 [Micrococcales bacterium]|nr:translation initiation factor IF-3 [Micrococcales bacterium]